MSDIFDANAEFDENDAETSASLAYNLPPAKQLSSKELVDTDELPIWHKRSRVALSESEKEFGLFEFWLQAGSGRSTSYIANVYNLPESRILQIADKNNWAIRASEYDKFNMMQMLQQEKSQRAIEHKQRLENYRQQQEFLGRSLSSDAAKLAAIVNNTLNRFIENDKELEIRDLPAILNAANKAAEVGRNLQAGALGVDQLLTALEEFDE